MDLLEVSTAGVATFVGEGHRFIAPLAQCTHTSRGVGQESELLTPEMTCVEPGCGQTARTTFSLRGGGRAQRVFVEYRRVRDKLSEADAIKVVTDAVVANGGIPAPAPDLRRRRGGGPALDPDGV